MDERSFWGRGTMEDHRPDETKLDLPPEPKNEEEARMDDEGGSMLRAVPPAPDNNPKSQYGIKKVPTHSRIPWIAVIYEGIVMALGGIKYGPFNWRQNSVAASVYTDAIERHLSLYNAGEDKDDESGVTHLAHVRACCGILIDAQESGNLIDDRPKNEATIRAIKENYNVTNGNTKS